MEANDILRKLDLKPLEGEGGYFAETYRSGHSSAIYYLLTPDTFSALHRLASDEIYHFYLGDPVEMLLLTPDGSSNTLKIGPNIMGDMRLQVVVQAGVWQGSRLVEGGRYALMGTTMAPGFDPEGMDLGVREDLMARYPEARDMIRALTR